MVAEEDVYDYPVASVGPGVMQIDQTGQVYTIFWYNGLYTYSYQAKRTLSGWLARAVPNTGSLDTAHWFLGDQDGAVRRLLSRYQNGQYHGYYSYWRDDSYLITDTLLPFATARPLRTIGRLEQPPHLLASGSAGPRRSGRGPISPVL